MSKEKSNMFLDTATRREQEQKEIQADIVRQEQEPKRVSFNITSQEQEPKRVRVYAIPGFHPPVEDGNIEIIDPPEPRTTMTVSMSVTEKRRLKQYAAAHGKTVASIVQDWIAKYCGNT